MGATTVGKTAVALALAASLGAEIVNADSLQVYRELDIGTAKPTILKQGPGTPSPHRRGRPPGALRRGPLLPGRAGRPGRPGPAGVPPLVVGGTGLYLKALLGGLFARAKRPRG